MPYRIIGWGGIYNGTLKSITSVFAHNNVLTVKDFFFYKRKVTNVNGQINNFDSINRKHKTNGNMLRNKNSKRFKLRQ